MAKKKTIRLGEAEQEEFTPDAPVAAPKNEPQPFIPTISAGFLVEIPGLATIDPTAHKGSNRIDTRLSRAEAATLKRLTQSLNMQNVALEDGRRVHTAPDALRWILQNVSQAETA